jgi:hypothetical protein
VDRWCNGPGSSPTNDTSSTASRMARLDPNSR